MKPQPQETVSKHPLGINLSDNDLPIHTWVLGSVQGKVHLMSKPTETLMLMDKPLLYSSGIINV